jgi:uncharacterized protein
MIHPHTELRFVSDSIGMGVFATRRIPRGTITWGLCPLDRVLSQEEVLKLPMLYRPYLDRYAYQDRDGNSVLCWDLGRYMNHSCEPATLCTGFDLDIAIRDIEPGDEITCDYGMLNLDQDFFCHCGMQRCRRTVHPKDRFTFVERWDAQVRDAFRDLTSVDQVLWSIVKEREQVTAAAKGERPVPSCLGQFRPLESVF